MKYDVTSLSKIFFSIMHPSSNSILCFDSTFSPLSLSVYAINIHSLRHNDLLEILYVRLDIGGHFFGFTASYFAYYTNIEIDWFTFEYFLFPSSRRKKSLKRREYIRGWDVRVILCWKCWTRYYILFFSFTQIFILRLMDDKHICTALSFCRLRRMNNRRT